MTEDAVPQGEQRKKGLELRTPVSVDAVKRKRSSPADASSAHSKKATTPTTSEDEAWKVAKSRVHSMEKEITSAYEATSRLRGDNAARQSRLHTSLKAMEEANEAERAARLIRDRANSAVPK